MTLQTNKNKYRLEAAKRYADRAFSSEELKNAERLLAHIDQFESPQKELELVKFVMARHESPYSKAA